MLSSIWQKFELTVLRLLFEAFDEEAQTQQQPSRGLAEGCLFGKPSQAIIACNSIRNALDHHAIQTLLEYPKGPCTRIVNTVDRGLNLET